MIESFPRSLYNKEFPYPRYIVPLSIRRGTFAGSEWRKSEFYKM